MKTPPATPYLLPPDECVMEQPWTEEDGRPLADRLEHWDPFTDVELFRVLEVDLDAVRTSCQLGDDATFAVVASWYSQRTRLAAGAEPVELGALAGLARAPISLRVPGEAAGGRLDLRTQLVLRHPGENPSMLAPRRAGAVLWTQQTRLALEGTASRFPVTAVDFSAATRLPDDGSWALEWEPEHLDAPVLSAMRLLVNSDQPELLSALRSGSADPRSSLVRSFITLDVARTLIESALRNDQFVDDPEGFDEGSLGRMLFELLATYWPGVPVRTLVSRAQDDPTRLAAELQARIGVLG